MFLVSVRFELKPEMDLAKTSDLYASLAPKYRDVPGLVTKYYIHREGVGGAVYVWQSREAAEALFTDTWRATLARRYGSEPQIEWLNNPVTVDNIGGLIANDKAA